eukprot:3817127-Pleurochrysis_carterae.AAC.2
MATHERMPRSERSAKSIGLKPCPSALHVLQNMQASKRNELHSETPECAASVISPGSCLRCRWASCSRALREP